MIRIGAQFFLPYWAYELLRQKYRQTKLAEDFDFDQESTQIRCGNYQIKAPSKHLLIDLIKHQPYRDLCIGIAAKYISSKYPGCTMLDIGANIGDTAAMIATYANNDLILVEASGYFFQYLSENSRKLPNNVKLLNAMVSTGETLNGELRHWGGTAYFHECENEASGRIATIRLRDIANENTRLIKIDTDGHDIRILRDSMTWLSETAPAILFENQINSEDDLADANSLFKELMLSGYVHFIFWDDPGYHLISTESLEEIADLNRYLLKITHHKAPKSLFNYDVLCLHAKDRDVGVEIRKFFANH